MAAKKKIVEITETKLELDVIKLKQQFKSDTPIINGLVLDGVSQFLSYKGSAGDYYPSTNMIKFLLDMGILKPKNQDLRNELLLS